MPGGGFAFGPYQLDAPSKRLLRHGTPVDLSPRQFAILHTLVSRAPEVVSKDILIKAGWHDVIVGDSSVEKMIYQLRQHLDQVQPDRYIKTIARRGYQWVAALTLIDGLEANADVTAELEPHRAWTDGRALLETLLLAEVAVARAIFEALLAREPREARLHIALANACVMQYEATRTDAAPDVAALHLADVHAQTACRLRPDLAEAWATLGFVQERTVGREAALAAFGRALALDEHNWLHLVRLAAASWGPGRRHAARQALAQYPHLPLAHWLIATVYVAGDALDMAERELAASLAFLAAEAQGPVRFSAVAFDWLQGLLCLSRGAADDAMAAFARECALETRGHVYGRESAANAWYATGACALRRGDRAAARAAFGEALVRVPRHPMAHAGLAILDGVTAPVAVDPRHGSDPAAASDAGAPGFVDRAFARAAILTWAGDVSGAVAVVTAALTAAPPGNAGWLLPIEPLLRVQDARDAWTPALAALHVRAR